MRCTLNAFCYGLSPNKRKVVSTMTKEEVSKLSKAECKAFAHEGSTAYTEMVQEGKFEEAVKLDELIREAVKRYNAIAQTECFTRLLSTEDPMLEAVKSLVYPTIRVSDGKTKDEAKLPYREIKDSVDNIDLLKLNEAAGKAKVNGYIGKDPLWEGYVEKFNFHMTARAAKRVIKTGENLTQVLKSISDTYAMAKIARDIDYGKDPTSNTKLLATFQTVVNAMIGEEYKATSHDVRFLCDVYARKDRHSLTVLAPKHGIFRSYIAAILHSIVTGEDYSISFKKTKSE